MQELPVGGAEADLLLVEGAGERRVIKLYRAGVDPKSEVLERIGWSTTAHVVQLFEHGRSEGRSYEVLEYCAAGSLRTLIAAEGPKLDQRLVREVLEDLAEALTHIHRQGITHRDLKPENILVRERRSLDLVLTDFGIASLLEGISGRFTQGHRTAAYAPPEAAARQPLVSAAWDYWSLGMILVEVLTGRHPFEHWTQPVIDQHLATRPVDTSEVHEDWRLICRGLLTRDPKKRWGPTQVDAWLKGERNIAVADEAPVVELAGYAPYKLEGELYHSPRELARGLAIHWDKAIGDLERGWINEWMWREVKDHDLARFIAEELEKKYAASDPVAKLFRLIVHLDPSLPPTYMGRDISEAGLKELATAAAGGDAKAQRFIESLYRNNILVAYATATKNKRYAQIEAQWIDYVGTYDRHLATAAQAGAAITRQAEPQQIAMLLLAVLVPATVVAMRKEAARLATRDALACEWYGGIGHARTGSPPALLASAVLSSSATSQTVERRQREQAQRAIEQAASQARRARMARRAFVWLCSVGGVLLLYHWMFDLRGIIYSKTIDELMNKAESQARVGHLASPGVSALATYEEILAIIPSHSGAIDGIEKLLVMAINEVSRSVSANNSVANSTYYQSLPSLVEALKRHRNEPIEQFSRRGRGFCSDVFISFLDPKWRNVAQQPRFGERWVIIPIERDTWQLEVSPHLVGMGQQKTHTYSPMSITWFLGPHLYRVRSTTRRIIIAGCNRYPD